MTTFSKNIFLLLCGVLLVPSVVSAETVLRIGDSVSLADDQKVEGDFYAAAGQMSLSGTIAGDAHVVGGSVTVNGDIENDLFIIGGTAQVHAAVADDLRIVGGEVTVAESVGGDIFVIGGVLTVLSSADVEGNIFFYGGEAEINGDVGGSIFGAAESIRVDGAVQENVDVTVVNSLQLGDRADVSGYVRFESQHEITRAQNAVVVGDITHNELTRTETVNVQDALVPILMYAFAVLVLFALFRNRLQQLLDDALQNITKYSLVGLGALFVLPIVVVLLLVSVIGFIVGLAAAFGMLLLYLLSSMLLAIFVGVVIEKIVQKSTTVTLPWTLAGIVTVFVIAAIPVVGPLLLFVGMLLMLGMLLFATYSYLVS